MKLINSEENFTKSEEETLHVFPNDFDLTAILQTIADAHTETSFMVCDVVDIVKKYTNWITKVPRVKPYYAVKCNNYPLVLEVLAQLGTGFDCASKGELEQVLSLGVDPSRIIYANPTKLPEHLTYASNAGVRLATFDSDSELHKMKMLSPEVKAVIRIVSDAKTSSRPLSAKFGCDATRDVPRLLRLARRLGITVVGVAFHVGCECEEPEAFTRAISTARDVFDCAASLGFRFELLDLGGGYPGNMGPGFDKIAASMNEALDRYFPDENIEIIAEPGRYFVHSAFTLACKIHSVKEVMEEDLSTRTSKLNRIYYITEGVYSTLSYVLNDPGLVKIPKPLFEDSGRKQYLSTIWGPTCDTTDLVIKDIMLPDLKIDDWIVYDDMGAYTLVCASTFNGFPLPKVFATVHDKWHPEIQRYFKNTKYSSKEWH